VGGVRRVREEAVMSINKRLHIFFVKREGGKKLFEAIEWNTIVGGVFYAGQQAMQNNSVAFGLLTKCFSCFLLILAIYIGLHNFIIPFLKVFYGNQLRRKFFFRTASVMYILLSLLYIQSTIAWFDIVIKQTIK
jgi:hypothetical protein